ncbi:13315_t:CDS:2, partial [Gigaspora rosea]
NGYPDAENCTTIKPYSSFNSVPGILCTVKQHLYNCLYHYILISQCLFLAILNVFITSSESQETTSNNTYINYTESTAGTSYPLNPPQVVTVHTYDDGTILVSIAREIDSTRKNIATSKTSKQEYNCTGQSLEQILRLRIIQLDGTIKEIVPHLTLDQ